MTVIDEHTRIPPLDETTLQRLACALDHEGVVAAMLIGSQARGTAGPLSDIDVAFWHEPSLDPSARLELRLLLIREATCALETNEVDVIPLNHASPLIRHRAIRDGSQLLEGDRETRVNLEARAIVEYLDTIPLRAEVAREQRKRIEEGRFGRR